jgi:hypothetical protein
MRIRQLHRLSFKQRRRLKELSIFRRIVIFKEREGRVWLPGPRFSKPTRRGRWGHLPSEPASYRQRIGPWLISAADRTPPHLRPWFRVSEIADYCASILGSVELDQNKRARALELLRRAILAGEFDDAKKRSKVANLHPSPAAELRFARDSTAIAHYFPGLAEHLWIRRADCKEWFERNQIEFPMRWLAAMEAAADQKTRAPGIVAKVPSATKSQRFHEKSAKEFVERYCEKTEKAGHIPRQEDAAKAAQKDGYVGSRFLIRSAFKEPKGPPKVGRPQKVKSPVKDGAN